MTGFDSKRSAAADKLQEPEREALKLALEAQSYAAACLLNQLSTKDKRAYAMEKLSASIAAIEKALAQPAQERPWVGLTDEEIRDCLGPEAVRISPGWSRLTRAIEAKLKERNS